MKTGRLIWADSLKGVLITLVVLGHSIQNTLGVACDNNHIWNIIYSFHMPAFMAVSGYLAYHPGSSAINREGYNWKKQIFRRFCQLMIPFFLWSAIRMIITDSFIHDAIIDVILYPDKGFWFLWVLFFISSIFILGGVIADLIKAKQEFIIISICILLVCAMLFLDIRVLGFQFIAYYFLFYLFGYLLHKYDSIFITKNGFILCLLACLWLFLAWFWRMHELPYFLKVIPLPNTLLQYLYRFITAIIAIYLLIASSPLLINNNKAWNVPLVKIGCVSLGIYTCHSLFLGYLNNAFNSFGLGDSWNIVFSFIIGLLLSWFIVWLLGKWSVTAKLFLGKL